MSDKNANQLERIKSYDKYRRLEELIKLIFRGLIPLVFLVSGIALLALRITGWSIILGLPLVMFGMTFMIYTYDEVVSRVLPEVQIAITRCHSCGASIPRYAGMTEKDLLCSDCQEKIDRAETEREKSVAKNDAS